MAQSVHCGPEADKCSGILALLHNIEGKNKKQTRTRRLKIHIKFAVMRPSVDSGHLGIYPHIWL